MKKTKRVLGLDLGTTSIGWALVEEAENREDSKIIKLGVRVNPLTTDEKTDFEKGKPLSTNADRTAKRGARRNLQRYKLRRKNLIELLIKSNFITKDTPLTEIGKNTTHQTLELRSKAARERIELDELARILLTINKKRGYKSSRKAKNEEDSVAIDGMAVAKHLYDEKLTPGQYVLSLLKDGKKHVPDFYRSDLQNEFDFIWAIQKQFYPDILDDELYNALKGQGKLNSQKRFLAIKGIYTAENKGKRDEVKLQAYTWRSHAIYKQLSIQEVAYVLIEVNNNLNSSSGYLGAISDRSKELYFSKTTVGQYLYELIKKNPHTPLKNLVFYRQDYLDEFERIWETQSNFHSNLTNDLKEEIRDIVIFYQRKLKSQKGLISFCQFESWETDQTDKTGKPILNQLTGLPKRRQIGQRVIPKSSPLFQEFKIWQNINNLQLKKVSGEVEEKYDLDDEARQLLFNELNLRGKLKEKEVLKLLVQDVKDWKTNFPDGLEGNETNQAFFHVYQKIAHNEGYGFDWQSKTADEILEELIATFPLIGINPEILKFDAHIQVNDFSKQASYLLWHLLYSVEDDVKLTEEDRMVYGNSAVTLKKNLNKKFGFKPEYAKMMTSVSLKDDYGSLSAKAIRKILPFLENGNKYDEACALAGYKHSISKTKEENEKRELKDKLELLSKNSLRNPVVEKILNQMVNLINQVIDEYGKPDEVRIELARELKKSAKEREESTKGINTATRVNDDIRKLIRNEFGFSPTRNDIIRYKLWEELNVLGHKTVFTNKYIPKEKIFSKEIDIEHIIPKAMLFDDSFSNKTLAYRNINQQKGNRTAIDFISTDFNSELDAYKSRVEKLFDEKKISKGKYKKLLMTEEKLPTDFIERDLRNSQYIAKKAKNMLLEVFRNVIPTTGRVTDKLRSDWDLINVMKELNLPKYKALGLTEKQIRWDSGQEKEKEIEIIKDWTKRNDHRHHAMDALTVAFTTHNHIQYINNLNASRDKKNAILYGVRNVITEVNGTNGNNKRRFISPLPNFRTEAKKHIESILISFKTKNKVVTRNINKITKGGGEYKKIQLTPRGQLHKETVYGKVKRPLKKPTKLNSKFSLQQANLIADKNQKAFVLKYLGEFNNDPALAFNAKMLKNTPMEWQGKSLTEVYCFEEIFTIKKEVTPDLKLDKIVDEGIRVILKKRLEAYGNDAKKAFTELNKNPIWLNEEKGISIKRVTITGVSNAEALHYKKDLLGKTILDVNKEKQAVDYVSTGNNHHVAIYKDEKGKFYEKVVSFYEAVERTMQGLDIINKTYNEDIGWEFQFTMKQNEMFVFPSEQFDPQGIDLMDTQNAAKISQHLYRVQKFTSNDYFFRFHLETTVENNKETSKYAWIRCGLKGIGDIIKVRLNHLGKIVHVGEY